MSVNIDASEWRLTTSGGIPYKLVSSEGSFSEEEAEGREVYIIRASDLLDFVHEGFPDPTFNVATGMIYYTRRAFMPGLPLHCERIAWKAHDDSRPIDPFGNDPTAPDGTYGDYVRLEVEYGTSPSNDAESDPNDPLTFLEVTANGGGEFIPTQARTATWLRFGDETTDDPVREAHLPQTIACPEVEWSVRWSQIPYNFFNQILITRLRERLGTVNDAVMPILQNAPAETVLFAGWSLSQQFTWRPGLTGRSPVKLELKLVERNFVTAEGVQVTWNHQYRPGKGFRRILFNGTDPIYASTAMNNLFST